MNFADLVHKNEDCAKKEKELKKLQTELKENNSRVDFAEFEALSFDEMERIYPLLYQYSSSKIRKRLTEVYKSRKETVGAVTYPILNTLTSFSMEQIQELDAQLAQMNADDDIQQRLSCSNNFSETEIESVINYLILFNLAECQTDKRIRLVRKNESSHLTKQKIH